MERKKNTMDADSRVVIVDGKRKKERERERETDISNRLILRGKKANPDHWNFASRSGQEITGLGLVERDRNQPCGMAKMRCIIIVYSVYKKVRCPYSEQHRHSSRGRVVPGAKLQ